MSWPQLATLGTNDGDGVRTPGQVDAVQHSDALMKCRRPTAQDSTGRKQRDSPVDPVLRVGFIVPGELHDTAMRMIPGSVAQLPSTDAMFERDRCPQRLLHVHTRRMHASARTSGIQIRQLWANAPIHSRWA